MEKVGEIGGFGIPGGIFGYPVFFVLDSWRAASAA